VILVSKASARPAHYRNLENLKSLDEVLAVTVDIRNFRIRSHPDSVIDASSEMLGELTVDFLVDHRLSFCILMNIYLYLRK
jgi:hypothetical protein